MDAFGINGMTVISCSTGSGMSMTVNTVQFSNSRRPGRRLLRLWAAAAFTIAAGAGMSGASAQQVMGWLELKPLPGRNMVQITGHALALEKIAGFEFTMSVVREGAGGKSISQQKGHIDLAAGETKVLPVASVNTGPGVTLTITLKIMDHAQEVFSTVMSAKPPDRQTL
jgi:hypothetical protein